MTGFKFGVPNIHYIDENDLSLKELSKYGYFDQNGQFREKKDQAQIEKDFSLSFSKVDLSVFDDPQIDITKYRFNEQYQPVLSPEKRLEYLTFTNPHRNNLYKDIDFAKDKIYYCFINPNNQDLSSDGFLSAAPKILTFSMEEKTLFHQVFKEYSQLFQIEFSEYTAEDFYAQKIKPNCKPYLIAKVETSVPGYDKDFLNGFTQLSTAHNLYSVILYSPNYSNPFQKIKKLLKFVISHETAHLFTDHTFFGNENKINPVTLSIMKRQTHIGDSAAYSMMSYTPHPMSKANISNPAGLIFPKSFMHDDILAISHFLKLNPTLNTGNTIFKIAANDISLSTTSDRSGIDIVDFSEHEYSWVNLSKEGFASGDLLPFQRCIGPFTDIENAIGGKNFSFFYGNEQENDVTANKNGVFLTGAGNDTHREGNGQNIHFFAYGTGQDHIISNHGKTEIHLMHYQDNDFMVYEDDEKISLRHKICGDQITYHKSKTYSPESIKIIMNNNTLKISDFEKINALDNSPSDKSLSTKQFPDFTKPELLSQEYYLKNGKQFMLKELVKFDYKEQNIRSISVENLNPSVFEMQFKSKGIVKNKLTVNGDDFSDIILNSKVKSGAAIGKLKFRFHYENNVTYPLTLGFCNRNLAPIASNLFINHMHASPEEVKITFDTFTPLEIYYDYDNDPMQKAEIIIESIPNNTEISAFGKKVNVGDIVTLSSKTDSLKITSTNGKCFHRFSILKYKARFSDGSDWSNFCIIETAY